MARMVTFSIKMAVNFCNHVTTAISPQELSSMFFPGGPLVFLVKNPKFYIVKVRTKKLEPGYCSRFIKKVTTWVVRDSYPCRRKNVFLYFPGLKRRDVKLTTRLQILKNLIRTSQ